MRHYPGLSRQPLNAMRSVLTRNTETRDAKEKARVIRKTDYREMLPQAKQCLKLSEVWKRSIMDPPLRVSKPQSC